MSEPEYIWICRWEDFQHYKPERDRPPAWIKSYTKQLDDGRYLGLTAHQRGVLGDLRSAFSRTHGRLLADTRQLTHRLHVKVTTQTLESLNQAGFIDLVSRETLDQRLEKLYSSPRARVEGELDLDKEPPYPRRRRGKKPSPQTTPEPPEPEIELPPPDERHRIAAEVRAQLLGASKASSAPTDNGHVQDELVPVPEDAGPPINEEDIPF